MGTFKNFKHLHELCFTHIHLNVHMLVYIAKIIAYIQSLEEKKSPKIKTKLPFKYQKIQRMKQCHPLPLSVNENLEQSKKDT